jgi:two-component system phosphate regulon sensor histidine kinase PhoR
MKVSFKKTYKFAVKSALYITLFNRICFAAGLYYVQLTFRRLYLFGLIFMLIVYLFSFIVLQYRVERFIYRRVKIYDDVSLLNQAHSVLRLMETLTRK